MEKKSEILENFKTAIGSTVKSLSNTDDVEVSFGNKNMKSEKVFIKLPEIEQINNKVNYDQIRAIADSESLKLRFSKTDIFKSYEPAGNISKKLYKIAEKIRYEKLGSEKFKGVKLKAESGVLDISAHNPDQESAEEKLDISGGVSGFDIAFNVNYLKEVLGTIDEEEISLVSFGSDKSALVESGDSNQVLVLMPLHL